PPEGGIVEPLATRARSGTAPGCPPRRDPKLSSPPCGPPPPARGRAAPPPERVAHQVPVPVITVSEDRTEVAIHVRGLKRPIEPTPRVMARADQALQILERYKARLDAVSASLSALEIEDLVTVRDGGIVLQ